ncbi:MAG: cellulase family glycosylhydrolase [Anaerolineae bacterium]
MSIWRRIARALLALGILLLVAGSALLAAWRPLLRPLAYSRVGEEWDSELIKGSIAYLSLQLRHPLPDLQPYTPMPHTSGPPFGINTFLEQEAEPEKVARSLDMIREAGFHYVRQEFPWEDIEITAKGDFWDHKWNKSAWDKYDAIVEMVNARGLELIVRLDHPPDWTRHDGDARGSFCPPDNLEDYGDFVETVVRRYKGRVRYYQIWNEPNIYPEWGEQPVDPEGYTRLLQMAYRRAKAADPDCVILCAGLAQTIEQGPRDLSDLIFLQRMYDAGVRGSFDVMGCMAYGIWTGATDHRTAPDRVNFSRAQLIRAIMVRNGDADKPIWATEIGWNSMPKELPGVAVYGRVKRQEQARYAVEAYQRAHEDWPWMGVMNYWFFRRATDTERDQPFYYFNLLEPDFTPWPAWDALSAYARQPARVGPGYRQEDHYALHYTGAWEDGRDAAAVLGGYRRGHAGAQLAFTFWGSELSLVTFGETSPTALAVTVDGKPARVSATRVQGRPALQLYWGWGPGAHDVQITVRRGAVNLDGLLVRRDERRGWLSLGVFSGAVLALVGWRVSAGLRRRRRS